MTPEAIGPCPQLDLTFAVVGGRSVLARRHVGYPFYVTAALRSPVPPAQVIVQSVSGGLYGGERVSQHVRVDPGARAVVRMPSASVVHPTRTGDAARHAVSLRVEEGATLFYLPRLLILFPGSVLTQTMDVTVADGATVLMRDGFMMHSPTAMVANGRMLRGSLTVRHAEGGLIAMDRIRIDDAVMSANVPGVTAGFRAFGAVWLIRRMESPGCQRIVAAITRLFSDMADCYAAITSLRDGGGALVRIAAIDGGALDTALDAAVGAIQAALAAEGGG